MKRQLVFLPIAAEELDLLGEGPGAGQRVAYTVTPELLDELGYDEADSEDAEYAALVLASVAALTRYGQRWVIVAEVDPGLVQPGDDPANGEVLLSQCPRAAMTAWFCEEPGVDVADAAAIAQGLSIDQAWEQPQVQELLSSHDLLWNDVVEYRPGKEA